MLDFISKIYRNRKVSWEKLLPYGFQQVGKEFIYSKQMSKEDFLLIVKITEEEKIFTEIIDSSFQERYRLHLVEEARGSFVAEIREEYEMILTEIAENCFTWTCFQNKLAQEIIEYIAKTYGDELEFLWPPSENAVWRRKESGKWYGVLLKISAKKLGISSEEILEVLNLHLAPELIASLLNNREYFPAYHMNKKHWISIALHEVSSFEDILTYLEDSYAFANKGNKKKER